MIAIPLKNLDSINPQFSPLFSKAPYFILIDKENNAQLLENTYKSGKEIAQLLYEKGVTTLIIKHLGEKAFQFFKHHKITLLYNDSDYLIRDILQHYHDNLLLPFQETQIQSPKHRHKNSCNKPIIHPKVPFTHQQHHCCKH